MLQRFVGKTHVQLNPLRLSFLATEIQLRHRCQGHARVCTNLVLLFSPLCETFCGHHHEVRTVITLEAAQSKNKYLKTTLTPFGKQRDYCWCEALALVDQRQNSPMSSFVKRVTRPRDWYFEVSLLILSVGAIKNLRSSLRWDFTLAKKKMFSERTRKSRLESKEQMVGFWWFIGRIRLKRQRKVGLFFDMQGSPKIRWRSWANNFSCSTIFRPQELAFIFRFYSHVHANELMQTQRNCFFVKSVRSVVLKTLAWNFIFGKDVQLTASNFWSC